MSQIGIVSEKNVLRSIADEALAEYINLSGSQYSPYKKTKLACNRALFKRGYYESRDRAIILPSLVAELASLYLESFKQTSKEGEPKKASLIHL